jgi:hypothetical protein
MSRAKKRVTDNTEKKLKNLVPFKQLIQLLPLGCSPRQQPSLA